MRPSNLVFFQFNPATIEYKQPPSKKTPKETRKRKFSKIMVPSNGCPRCGVITTPQWRNVSEGAFCNACALHDIRRSKNRNNNPRANDDEHVPHKRKHKHPNKCQHCGATATPQWREGPEGPSTLCNACGLHYANSLQKDQANNTIIRNHKMALSFLTSSIDFEPRASAMFPPLDTIDHPPSSPPSLHY